MFTTHPALLRVLEQDRYHRLLNERRRSQATDRPTPSLRKVR